jgi:hypothetical protein
MNSCELRKIKKSLEEKTHSCLKGFRKQQKERLKLFNHESLSGKKSTGQAKSGQFENFFHRNSLLQN